MRQTVRALIVEDHPGDAELTKIRLAESTRVHFEVHNVPSLQEGLHWMTINDCDVAILDLNLPDSLGLESLEEFRRRSPEVPVVIVSGAVDNFLRDQAMALEAEEVISKEQLGSSLFSSSILFAVERSRAREKHRQLEKVLDTIPDAVVVADRQGVVKYVNGQAMNFFGRSARELMAEPMMFSAKEGTTVELRVLRQGSERIGEMRLVTLEWAGVPCFLASIRDVTTQRTLELQLLTSDRLVSLGTLAAGVAHEINNPLAAVLANVAMAHQHIVTHPEIGELVPDLADIVGDARDATERIRQIVRDLRIFSRAEEDSRAAYDIHRILDSVCRMAWTEIRHSARLVKRYGAVDPVWVNESRVSQVFLNILVNAAQAIPPGNATGNTIEISTRAALDGRVLVEFADTGPGIPEDVQRRMFTPFFTTKPAGVGTGLGLAICQRIVHSLGGEISFKSVVGQGTRFTISLPGASLDRLAPIGPQGAVASAERRRRVLVIDDDPMILKAVGRVLGVDHDVTNVNRALQALKLIEQGTHFDIILCDLMMPEMTGMEFADRLVTDWPAQAERIVFMTGGALTPHTREFLDTVNNQRIEKPFDAQGLRALVNAFVSK